MRFVCTSSDPFSVLDLPRWLEAERAAGRLPDAAPVQVEVSHPLREADGSCRWCGAGPDEVVTVAADGSVIR